MLPTTAFSNCVMTLLLVLGSLAHSLETAAADEPKTAKERLVDKASDEQRVDDCGVPLERRGPTPRPGCSLEGKPSVPAAGQGAQRAEERRR
jgi:hypothetical protein